MGNESGQRQVVRSAESILPPAAVHFHLAIVYPGGGGLADHLNVLQATIGVVPGLSAFGQGFVKGLDVLYASVE